MNPLKSFHTGRCCPLMSVQETWDVHFDFCMLYVFQGLPALSRHISRSSPLIHHYPHKAKQPPKYTDNKIRLALIQVIPPPHRPHPHGPTRFHHLTVWFKNCSGLRLQRSFLRVLACHRSLRFGIITNPIPFALLLVNGDKLLHLRTWPQRSRHTQDSLMSSYDKWWTPRCQHYTVRNPLTTTDK